MNQFVDVIPILDVHDVNKALDFYVEKLGFKIEFRNNGDSNNYAGVFRDGVYLHMQWQHEEEFQKGTAGRLRLRINVDEPDALFQEYKNKDVIESKIQIKDTPWGTREFGIRDLDGNGLIFYRDL